jgi:hypothetical protein
MNKVSTKGETMHVNLLMRTAAKNAVTSEHVTDMPVEVPGYPGMFVAQAEQSEIQQIYFFEHDSVRYALGPKRQFT